MRYWCQCVRLVLGNGRLYRAHRGENQAKCKFFLDNPRDSNERAGASAACYSNFIVPTPLASCEHEQLQETCPAFNQTMTMRIVKSWLLLIWLVSFIPSAAHTPIFDVYEESAVNPLAAGRPVTRSASQESSAPVFKVDYISFTLRNGLQVIFHVDRSDPVVAVALTAHVGSAREKEGRTGFAHLFEHLLFLESENLGKGGLDKMSARIGGSGANGSTSRDRTNYFQTVPKDALEKMIWAEADKLGWFINTVTEPVLAKEKQVVKNEKRQGVDNSPYGHTSYVIDGADMGFWEASGFS